MGHAACGGHGGGHTTWTSVDCGETVYQVLPVTEDDDDGVIGVDEDLDVRTAPLGVMSGAVVGVVTGCPSC